MREYVYKYSPQNLSRPFVTSTPMRRVSYSTKPQILSYIDAIGVFNDETVIDDLNASCQKLAQSMVALMQTFEAISTQLHTLDLQGLTPEPWKPRWNYIRKVRMSGACQH